MLAQVKNIVFGYILEEKINRFLYQDFEFPMISEFYKLKTHQVLSSLHRAGNNVSTAFCLTKSA